MPRRKYERMVFKAPPHPSGRPLRQSDYRERGFPRLVHDEPLTPGLKPGRQQTAAIGFTARLAVDDEE